ncbi:MAG: hypothetical protein R3A79_12255 [Nannocystaceae bacterium]
MTDERPTRERPYAIGEHRLFYTHGDVPVIVYRGDVAPEQAAAIVDFTGHGSRLEAVIADVQELGAFGAKTRKALIDTSRRQVHLTVMDLFVVISGANVVRRAVMTMVTTAARLVTTRRITVHHTQTLDEALVAIDEHLAARRST